VDHTTIWQWTQTYAPEVQRQLRGQLKLKGCAWHIDETFVKIAGVGCIRSALWIAAGRRWAPADAIRATRPKAGIPDAIDTAYIQHASGGSSALKFKSYEQGREALEENEVDLIALDEEPPEEIYTECVLCTMAAGSSGRQKVFSSCQRFLEEYRLYRRDAKGKIVKTRDHLMDATATW
jgi:hypothetical protein